MMRCPRCGSYMSSHVVSDYCGGWVQIWSCLCGYYEPNNEGTINTNHTVTTEELHKMLSAHSS